MSASSCDKIIRAICTGDVSELDPDTFVRITSEDMNKLRALTLDDGDIKYAGDGMWGSLLALNLLFNSDVDEKNVRDRCGDDVSLFMLALICSRVELCRTLLNTFNIPLASRSKRGISTLDLAPPALKNELKRLLDLELKGINVRKPEPAAAAPHDFPRSATTRDLRSTPSPPLALHNVPTAVSRLAGSVAKPASPALIPMSRFASEPNLSHYAETPLVDLIPMSRAQIDALTQYSSLELLQRALQDLELYVADERARLAQERNIKSMEMMARTLKDTDAGPEARVAVLEASTTSKYSMPDAFGTLERVAAHRRERSIQVRTRK